MSEDLHTTAAPPEVTIYPEAVAEFVGPRTAPARPGEPILDFSLRAAILTACDELEAASARYTAASAVLAEATIDLHERRMQHAYGEDTHEARTACDTALFRHARAEHDLRAADIAQKALRARLYALTALLGRS